MAFVNWFIFMAYQPLSSYFMPSGSNLDFNFLPNCFSTISFCKQLYDIEYSYPIQIICTHDMISSIPLQYN